MVEGIEEEQIETLKNWWNTSGKSLLGVVMLGVVGVFGYQAWQNNIEETGIAAAAVYQSLTEAISSLDAGTQEEGADTTLMITATSLANKLKTVYAGTAYARFAALHLARLAIDNGELDSAASELEWVLERGSDESLESITRIRLARVRLAQDNPEEALAVLDGSDDNTAQRTSREEVRGDIYHAMGDMARARDAYQLALDHLPDKGERPLLKMKLANLNSETNAGEGETTPDAAPQTPADKDAILPQAREDDT